MRAAASISIRELTMRPIRPVNAGDGLLRSDSTVVSWQQSGAAARCNGRIWARAIYSNGTMAQSELVIRGIYFTQVNAICCAASQHRGVLIGLQSENVSCPLGCCRMCNELV